MIRKVLLSIAILVIFVFIFSAIFRNYSVKAEVLLGGKVYVVDIADNLSLQEKGLSDRKTLKDNQGMLFIFNTPGKYGFWMKDMRFPIDIVWISDKYQVVGIEKTLLPDTYPKIFTPDAQAQYVLEISAGEIDKLNVKIGDSVQISKKIILK